MDVPVSTGRLAPHGRVQQQTVDVPIEVIRLAHQQQSVEVAVVPYERVQQRTVEQIAGAPQCMEETVEAEMLVPRERVQRRITEQIVEVPLPQKTEDAEDVVLRVARIIRNLHETLCSCTFF